MRVLVIEDFTPLRQALAEGLAEASYAVDVAADGEAGLRYARANPYDVIVLDLMIPGVDGLTLLKLLRRGGSNAHVLILTARDELDDRLAGLNGGADDYLTKPFEFSELLARINALVRRGYAEKSPVIEIGDLRLDTGRRLAHRGEREIDLSAREYMLLEYLARHRGEVVSRSAIWDHTYEMLDEAKSNVVDVYVGYLRKKLEADGEPRLLHTRRGYGYVLEERPLEQSS